MSERTLVNELDKLVEDSNIYNKVNSKTQKELNEENEVLRNCIESELEDVTVEGTEITVDDAANYYAKIVLKGNTEQASYGGKSLIDYSALARYNRDLSGAPSVGSPLRYYNNSKAIQFNVPVTALRGKNIYISFDFQNTNFRRFALDANNNYIETFENGRLIKDSYSYIAVIINSNIDIPISTDIKFMTEQGSTATDYEPYVGGVPSPNPNYPQDIHVVTGENTIHVNNTDYIIDLIDIELGNAMNYQEYFFKNEPNNPHYNNSLIENAWYGYERLKKMNLRGEKLNGTAKACRYSILNISPKINYAWPSVQQKRVICDKYRGVSQSYMDANPQNYCISSRNNDGFFIYDKDKTLSEIQDYFNNNDVIVYYVRETPLSTQITDETLISQLDEIYEHLKLVKGTNNITVTAEDLVPYIELTYKRSNAIKFQKEIDELKAIVLENS